MVDQPGAVVGCAFTVPNPFDDAAEVQVIGGPAGRRVGLQSAASSFDEAQRADPVATFGMGDAYAQLGQSLPPFLTFLGGTRFPARLEHLVGGERPALRQQLVRSRDCLHRWQRLLGHRLDADAAVRQRATEPIPRTRLPSSSLRISIPIASVTHTRKLPGCVTPTGPREDCGGRPTATAESGPTVEFRYLGNSGLRSEITCGNWLTHGSQVENDQATACVRAALDAGVSTFDTADSYANTMAETVLGEALKGERRESLEILTKVFWSTGPGGPNDIGLSRKHIMESINGSLSRLQTDYVDLYQAHRFDHETPLDETMQAFADVVRMGKALYIGVGEWTAQQIQDGHDLAEQLGIHLISNQPQYSMLWRVIEGDVVPVCVSLGISQIVFSPIAQGVLTGKYRRVSSCLPARAPPMRRAARTRSSGGCGTTF